MIRKEHTMDVNQDSFDRCQFTIPNLTTHFSQTEITVGDLFVTGKELVFIPLASALHSGSLEGIAFLIGGLVGGLIASQSNADALSLARAVATDHRQKDFGMPLQERVQNYSGLVIPKKNISSIEKHERVVRIVHGDNFLDLGSDNPLDCQTKLENWSRGGIECDEDPQGINLGLTPPAKLLGWLENGSNSHELTPNLLSALFSQKDYLKSFFQQFDRLKFSKKRAIVNSIGLLPITMGSIFQDHLEELRRKGQLALYLVPLILVFGLFSVIYQCTGLISSGTKDTSLFDLLTIFGVLSLVFSIPSAIYHLAHIGKDKLLCKIAANKLGGRLNNCDSTDRIR
jgi:hypothetical protein